MRLNYDIYRRNNKSVRVWSALSRNAIGLVIDLIKSNRPHLLIE